MSKAIHNESRQCDNSKYLPTHILARCLQIFPYLLNHGRMGLEDAVLYGSRIRCLIIDAHKFLENALKM